MPPDHVLDGATTFLEDVPDGRTPVREAGGPVRASESVRAHGEKDVEPAASRLTRIPPCGASFLPNGRDHGLHERRSNPQSMMTRLEWRMKASQVRATEGPSEPQGPGSFSP